MTANRHSPPGTWGVGRQQGSKSSLPLFDFCKPPEPPRLTPRHRRIIDALTAKPDGILSFELRAICGAMNVADEVQQLRKLGHKIVVEMEPFVTVDGVKSRIGRYRLVTEGTPA